MLGGQADEEQAGLLRLPEHLVSAGGILLTAYQRLDQFAGNIEDADIQAAGLGQLEVDIHQVAGRVGVGEHFACQQAGLIDATREGQFIRYSLDTTVLDEAVQWLVNLMAPTNDKRK